MFDVFKKRRFLNGRFFFLYIKRLETEYSFHIFLKDKIHDKQTKMSMRELKILSAWFF